jgi:uncharacterized protein (DUF488 family)
VELVSSPDHSGLLTIDLLKHKRLNAQNAALFVFFCYDIMVGFTLLEKYLGIISTIGYEQSNIKDFIAQLKSAKIQRLLDIRELPISRRKGFSKQALKSALEDAGIAYDHLKALGDPKLGREAAREGRYAEFEKIFSAHIQESSAQDALKLVSIMASREACCLLCYERDPGRCHRNIVAENLKMYYNLDVRHLYVRAGIAKKWDQTQASAP